MLQTGPCDDLASHPRVPPASRPSNLASGTAVKGRKKTTKRHFPGYDNGDILKLKAFSKTLNLMSFLNKLY